MKANTLEIAARSALLRGRPLGSDHVERPPTDGINVGSVYLRRQKFKTVVQKQK